VTTVLLTGQSRLDTHVTSAGQHLLPDGQTRHDTQFSHAVGDLLLTGHCCPDTQPPSAGQHLLPDGHAACDIQRTRAVGDPSQTPHNNQGAQT
jgi:hypothetical protein